MNAPEVLPPTSILRVCLAKSGQYRATLIQDGFEAGGIAGCASIDEAIDAASEQGWSWDDIEYEVESVIPCASQPTATDTSGQAARAAVSAVGLELHEFDDGAAMVAAGGNALHLSPGQFEQLQHFVRVFDQRREPVTLLTEARDIIYGDRERTHGEPDRNLRAIAAIWTAILAGVLQPGARVSEQLVCLMMIGLKLARAANAPSHREHWLDTVGYAALAERCGLVADPKAAEADQAELRG